MKENSKFYTYPTSSLRYFDMTPYWTNSENPAIAYPYNEMKKNEEFVPLNANELDKLFQLIGPDVPIDEIEIYDYPQYKRTDRTLMARFRRLIHLDIEHRSFFMYTQKGVFVMDRYQKRINMCLQTTQQFKAFLDKPENERKRPYYPNPGISIKTAQSDKTMYDFINILKLNDGEIVAKRYNLLFNNCIKNVNSWFKVLKKKK